MIMLGVSRLSYKMKPALNLIGEGADKTSLARHELKLRGSFLLEIQTSL
jgi:hypothetical protein